MAQFLSHTTQAAETWSSRLLYTKKYATDDDNRYFVEIGGWGIKCFEWAIVVCLFLMLGECLNHSINGGRNGNGNGNGNGNNNENENENGTDGGTSDQHSSTNANAITATPEEEEKERRRNNILKLYESELIQQKLTCDHIRNTSCKTVDTVLMDEEPQMVDATGHISDDDGDGDGDGDVSFDEEEGHGIVVLSQKTSTSNACGRDDNDNNNTKDLVDNLCVICLEDYHEGDTIVWSSNKNCRHAFHRQCLTDYLVRVKDVEDTYPCPTCRQNFFFGNDSSSTTSSS